MPQYTPKKHRRSAQDAQTVNILPGVTAVVIIPYKQKRAIGGLVRGKGCPEIKMRLNVLDREIITEGARLCGLTIADYARQCAAHMAQALKGQGHAPSPNNTGPRNL